MHLFNVATCLPSNGTLWACMRACCHSAHSVFSDLISLRPCTCRFAEKHRVLVNMLLRHSAALLQGSLAPLLRVPRLIDFDNKRTFFRSRVRAVSSEERHYGTLRICVRREHVFEDSFHQLRMRCASPAWQPCASCC